MNGNYTDLFNEISSIRIKKNNQIWQNINIAEFSLECTFVNSRECPHCGSHEVHSKGNYKGRKRYQCRNCGKSYNDLTKTPFSGVHNLEKIKNYLSCLMRGDSIRKAASTVNVSVPTSFHWRHRLLNSLKHLPAPRMKNVKEIMEVEIPYSHKGQRSNLTLIQSKAKVSAVFVCDRMGKLDSDSIEYSLRENNPIFKRIDDNSDKHTDIIDPPNFFNINNNSKYNLKPSNSSYSQTNTINQIISLWKSWMERFHGVATKYLANYLHWFDFLDNTLFEQDGISNFINLILKH